MCRIAPLGSFFACVRGACRPPRGPPRHPARGPARPPRRLLPAPPRGSIEALLFSSGPGEGVNRPDFSAAAESCADLPATNSPEAGPRPCSSARWAGPPCKRRAWLGGSDRKSRPGRQPAMTPTLSTSKSPLGPGGGPAPRSAPKPSTRWRGRMSTPDLPGREPPPPRRNVPVQGATG